MVRSRGTPTFAAQQINDQIKQLPTQPTRHANQLTLIPNAVSWDATRPPTGMIAVDPAAQLHHARNRRSDVHSIVVVVVVAEQQGTTTTTTATVAVTATNGGEKSFDGHCSHRSRAPCLPGAGELQRLDLCGVNSALL